MKMQKRSLVASAAPCAWPALFAALSLTTLGLACNDDLETKVVDAGAVSPAAMDGGQPDATTVEAGGGASDGAVPAEDGAGGGVDAGIADGGTPTAPENPGRGVAVVNSDYRSVSISLVDPATGAVVKDDCINSGTKPPAPALSFSGDVILPSAPQAGGALVVIDRTNAALTWVDPATCLPTKQLSVATGFGSNPQDILSISPTKAYVTRNVRNGKATPDPSDFDEGDDVLIIDPSVPAIKGRIALGSHASPLAGVDIMARPDRALLANGKAYVALGSLSADYKAAGFGRIAVIDPATDTVTGVIDLPNLKACRAMAHETTSNTLIVACSGLYADGPAKAATSGMVWIDLAASPPAIKATLPASAFAGRALSLERNIIALSESKGLVISLGEFKAMPTDQLWFFDRASGTATKLADSGASFEFGHLIHDRVRSQILLAEAAMAKPRLRVFSLTGDALAPKTEVNVNPSRGLPPRYLGWY